MLLTFGEIGVIEGTKGRFIGRFEQRFGRQPEMLQRFGRQITTPLSKILWQIAKEVDELQAFPEADGIG